MNKMLKDGWLMVFGYNLPHKFRFTHNVMKIIGKLNGNNIVMIDNRELGINRSTLIKCLLRMRKHNVIYKLQKDQYMVNPYYYGRACLKKINRLRKEWDKLNNH